MSRAWKILRFPVFIITGLIALFLILLFYLWVSGRVWYPRQRKRVEDLVAQYDGVAADGYGTAGPGDNQFAVMPLDGSLPLNELRMVASHNSYHLEPDLIRRVLIGLVEPDEPEKLRYTHATLWEQLDNGVRSFELDIRNRRNRFTITHAPLVDNRGPNPDLALALQEINTWSASHPGHVPVIILFEIKSDWMFLDPGLKPWDANALDRLDAVMREAFPSNRLLTPGNIVGTEGSVAQAVAGGWPPLGEVRGRVICVVHTDRVIDGLYAAGDPRLSGRAMFTSRPGGSDPEESWQPGTRPDAAFVVHNDPDAASMAPFLAAGLMARTRADGDGLATAEQRTAALTSGAQIISTDLPPGHPNDPSKGVVEFAVGKTLSQGR